MSTTSASDDPARPRDPQPAPASPDSATAGTPAPDAASRTSTAHPEDRPAQDKRAEGQTPQGSDEEQSARDAEEERAAARRRAARAALLFDDPLSRRSDDDSDRGWGERPTGDAADSSADLRRFLDEKPPHHL
ncbi:hypothetical protein [Streptomyces sp. NPDC059080]|uniref:hypothetical protein n=1 Tax=Streptomyces sp. NPDC059080 TaxID=3346718 RepID=UPI00367452F0